MEDINDVLIQTICTRCQYCFQRQIVPIDWKDEDSAFLEISCTVIETDLSEHIVKECSHFTAEEDEGPFAHNKFL